MCSSSFVNKQKGVGRVGEECPENRLRGFSLFIVRYGGIVFKRPRRMVFFAKRDALSVALHFDSNVRVARSNAAFCGADGRARDGCAMTVS